MKLFEPHFQIEIEAKFFIPFRRLTSHLDLKKLPFEIISQAYIPKMLVPQLLGDLDKRSARTLASHWAHCSRARLRQVTYVPVKGAARDTRYYLQMKSPKKRGLKRTEISIEVPRPLFVRLSPYASGGRIDKIRYIDRGFIFDAKGKKYPSEAHIDIIIAAGKELPKRVLSHRSVPTRSISNAPYAFVEIEFPKVSLLSRLKKPSQHTFPYLKQAINLVHEHPHIKEKIRTRFIARSGLDSKDVVSTLKKLMKRCA